MLGCDRLALRLVVREEDVVLKQPDVGSPSYFSDRTGLRAVEAKLYATGDAAVHIKLDLARGSMRIEFNPSRLLHPAGGLCRFEDLRVALDLALGLVDDQLGVFVTPPEREVALVQRIDVSRDFVMNDARALLPALVPLKRAWASRLSLNYDPKTLLVSGITVGNKESHCKLYVREGAHPEFPDMDWLRFETQAVGSWLQLLRGPAGVRGPDAPVRLADLTPDRCHRLLRDRWEWSEFGTPFLDTGAWWARAERELGVDKLRALAGYVFGLDRQVNLQYKPDAVKEHQALLKRLGVPVPLRLRGDAQVGEAEPLALFLDSDMPRPRRRRPRPRHRVPAELATA